MQMMNTSSKRMEEPDPNVRNHNMKKANAGARPRQVCKCLHHISGSGSVADLSELAPM